MADFLKIRENVNIIDVYERETGNEYRRNGSPCAFCSSSDAVKFQRNKNRYTCFSCRWGGGVVDFVAKLKNLSEYDAGEYIQSKYLDGLALTLDNVARPTRKKENAPTIQYKINTAINERFRQLCADSVGDPDLIRYLDGRGFSADVRAIWNIYTISKTDYYRINTTLKKEYNAPDLIASGLFSHKYDENGKLIKYNLIFCNHRILIFNTNDRGEVLGVKARAVPDTPTKQKDKYRCNYGQRLPFCTGAIYNARRGDRIAITEGEFDAIALNELGTPAVSVGGVSGSNQSRIFRALLERIARRGLVAVLTFDNDDKGQNAETSQIFESVARTVDGLRYIAEIQYKRDNIKDFADIFKETNGAGISYEQRARAMTIAEKYATTPQTVNVQEVARIEGVNPFEIRRGFMDLARLGLQNITFSKDYTKIFIDKL